MNINPDLVGVRGTKSNTDRPEDDPESEEVESDDGPGEEGGESVAVQLSGVEVASNGVLPVSNDSLWSNVSDFLDFHPFS